MRVAVVGGGIAGIGAAWLLASRHEVVVYESQPRLGGHAWTVDIPVPEGRIAVDVGFLVFNESNYPHFAGLLKALSVETVDSDMSFAVSLDAGDYEYGSSPSRFLAQPRNLVRSSFWRMTRDIIRFNRHANAWLATEDDPDLTISALIDQLRLSDDFKDRYLLPMASCIWSAPSARMLTFPARTFVRFFDNHGLLTHRPVLSWRTIRGGSRRYIERLGDALKGRLRLSTPVTAVTRDAEGVRVHDSGGNVDRFDRVVMACHADQALALLRDADQEECDTLGRFTYVKNEVVLHRDPSVMPLRRKVWSSWNYVANRVDVEEAVRVTYWINRIQPIATSENVFVSLNPASDIPDHARYGYFEFDHPLFDSLAIAAQRRINDLQGRRNTFFCGSYCGYGFHEDALRSAISVAAQLRVDPPWTLDCPS